MDKKYERALVILNTYYFRPPNFLIGACKSTPNPLGSLPLGWLMKNSALYLPVHEINYVSSESRTGVTAGAWGWLAIEKVGECPESINFQLQLTKAEDEVEQQKLKYPSPSSGLKMTSNKLRRV